MASMISDSTFLSRPTLGFVSGGDVNDLTCLLITLSRATWCSSFAISASMASSELGSWSILIAILVITLIMAVLFKSMKIALIALIPNVIPLIMVAGVMGFLDVDIKPSTAVIFTIALGIAVDDSIHYLARFRIEYARIGSVFPALSATTIRTGRAIVVTSMILIAGFGTLITSAFTSTAMMGVLVTTTIFSALLADLFVLPALFYWLKPDLKSIQAKGSA